MEPLAPQNQNQPKPTINRFGREYTCQGLFTDADILAKTIDNWKNAGHTTMVIKGYLYVSTLKTRKY